MHIAYFINEYPKVSHSFIRREIMALERQGITVQRIALRGWDSTLVDSEDLQEREQTHYVLRGGVAALFLASMKVLFTRPVAFISALLLATRMGRHADRPVLYHFIYLAEACQVLARLQKNKVQHIHAHFGTNSAEVVMLVHALGGPPFSFTVHGPEEFDKPQFIHLDEKIRRAAFVVAISSYGRSQLFRWVSHDNWEKIKVVHCGLEKAFHQDVIAGPANTSHRLVCVGRLCEQKGQLLLVEAVHQLVKKNIDVELVLAGDGEMRADVEKLIAEHNLARHVRITGWISSDQVRDEILAARALVLPSFAEGLPVVIMEAMALRRPVLTTYVAGIPELVLPGKNGWLFAAGSVEALSAAMEDCLSSTDESMSRMGEAAYQQVIARHDIDIEAGKLSALFKASCL